MQVDDLTAIRISPMEIRVIARCDPGGNASRSSALYLFTDQGSISINLWPAKKHYTDPHAPERLLIELRRQIDTAIESAQYELHATRTTS